MPPQVQHSSSEGITLPPIAVKASRDEIPSYAIPQVQHTFSEGTPLPSVVVKTPRDDIPSYPIPQVQHTLSEETLSSIVVKTPEIPSYSVPQVQHTLSEETLSSIVLKTPRDEILSYAIPQVQHTFSEGTPLPSVVVKTPRDDIPSYPILQVQHTLSEETLPSIVVKTPRNEIPSYSIPQVQHTLSEGTPLPSILVKTPRDGTPSYPIPQLQHVIPPPSIAVKTAPDEIPYVSNQQTPSSNQLKVAKFVPMEASRGLEAAREATSQIRTIASVPVQTTVSTITNSDSTNLLNSVSSFIQTLSKFNDLVQSIATVGYLCHTTKGPYTHLTPRSILMPKQHVSSSLFLPRSACCTFAGSFK